MENIYVYAFATFGHPNDFRQTCFLPERTHSDLPIKLFDLTNAIKVYPDTKLYSIRKEFINGVNTISYSIYTFAKEKLSERDGTFIGSSITYKNAIANENITIEKLNRFHNFLIEKNVIENRLVVNHSKDFLIGKIAVEDFDKINLNLHPINESSNFNVSNSNLLVFSRIDNNVLQQKLKKSLELLDSYDVIFFTNSIDIVDFTKNRGIYKVVDEQGFEQEIQNLQEEKKQKILKKIEELEKEKNSSEEKRKNTLATFDDKIKRDEATQVENKKKIDASRSSKNSIDALYRNYYSKIDELTRSLSFGKTLNEITTLQRDLKSSFEQELRKIENPSSIQSISNPRIETRNPAQNSNNPYGKKNPYNYENEDSTKTDSLTKLSLVLNILLIVALLISLFFNFWKKPEPENINYSAPQADNFPINDSIATKLNPKPDTILNVNDYKIVAKNLKDNTTINEVVEVIFSKNKNGISTFYKSQKEDYIKMLFEKNPNAFEVSNDTIFTGKDSLKVIPSMKINK